MKTASMQTIHTLGRTCAAALMCAAPLAIWAAPGAHGPGGEHLDDPAQTKGGTARPRVEAKSELFELVATLRGGELSILIDRFASNEPVLNAQVEVESGALKAKAAYHADLGDYAVDDPAFVKALSAPGEHALVVTVVAGSETDLLDGTLVTAAAAAAAAGQDGSDHGWSTGRMAGAAAAVLGVAACAAWLRARRRAVAAPMAGVL